jgi:putative N6-adenine-specific DNA methylase
VSDKSIKAFATTSKGLEDVLAGELKALGATKVKPDRGGVYFEGTRRTLYAANLWLRTALRVLEPIAHFGCNDPDHLYKGVRAVDWGKYLTPDHTLAVSAIVRETTGLRNSHVTALKVKDAVCDRLRDDTGRRPSVDRDRPDLPLHLHVRRGMATLSRDWSGESLHRRGYRIDKVAAPLREHLAAGILLLTGWDPATALADPMCGSGTLVIEAAMMAQRKAPGLQREHFAFKRAMDFDERLWRDVVAEARDLAREPQQRIVGSDRNKRAVHAAIENARRAGVKVHLAGGELEDFAPPVEGGPGVVVLNPPYGERLGEEAALKPVYKLIGDVFKQRCAGYNGWIFTGNRELAKVVGLRAKCRIPLYNGKIDSRLMGYDLYRGTKSDRPAQ